MRRARTQFTNACGTIGRTFVDLRGRVRNAWMPELLVL
jgi:hypothetical protein